MTLSLLRLPCCFVVGGVLWSASVAGGEERPSGAPDTLQSFSVTIQCNTDSARVMLDHVYAGKTPLQIDTLKPGIHFLKILHPDLSNWTSGSIADSFSLPQSGPLALRYTFDRKIFIISRPFAAGVYVRDSLLGYTPLLFTTDQKSAAPRVTIQKDGYETAICDLAAAQRGVVTAVLTPRWQKDPLESSLPGEENLRRSSSWRLYVTGATTVLSGIAAAYLKIQADEKYASYGTTADPVLLSETHRLDRASAIALVATQVSLGLFAYFLLSE
jgi:hypothetical protein